MTQGSASAPPPPPSPSPQSAPPSPLDGVQSLPDDRGTGLKVAMWVGIGVLVLGGAYVGGQYALANSVPQGTSMAGIDIGGKSRSGAIDVLQRESDSRAQRPIEVHAGDRTTTITAADAGLSLDVEATVDRITGFTLSPVRLCQHIAGGPEVEPVTVTGDINSSALENAARKLSTPATNGTVSFVDGRVYSDDPQAGQRVAPDDIAEALQDAWLSAPRIDVPAATISAEIDELDLQVAMAQADVLLAGPVRLTVAETFIELPARTIVDQATYVATGDRLELRIDGEALESEINSRLPDGVLSVPTNASLKFADGKPVIVPGQTGTSVDTAALSNAVSTAVTSPERTAPLPLQSREPEVTTESIEKLGIHTKVSSFSTVLNGTSARISNITLGAKSVDGYIIQPGETFSLGAALGPSTAERGYKRAGTITNGVLQDSYGGGLSQLTTTVYNAAFFAGLEDVEHRPHSLYFSRYPEGREATLSRPQLDLKFTNDTPYGIYLRAFPSGGRLHIEMWSTPYYTVETQTSKRSNVVQPKTITKTGPSCVSQNTGSPGFSVTVFRQVFLGDVKKKDEKWTWRYNPQNKIVCEADTPPPPPSPTPAPETGTPES